MAHRQLLAQAAAAAETVFVQAPPEDTFRSLQQAFFDCINAAWEQAAATARIRHFLEQQERCLAFPEPGSSPLTPTEEL